MNFREWEEVQLQDVINFNPKETIKKGAIVKKIGMEKLAQFQRKIEGYELTGFSSGTKFRNGDTLLARITPCLENGKTAQVTILEDGEIGFGSTEYIVMREKTGRTVNDFIFYLAISPKMRDIAIKSMTGTSGRQRAQIDVIKKTIMNIPPINEQKAIAHILSTLDKKIEVNNQINKTLEKMAQAIFKQWFVDFEFPNEDGEPYLSNGGEMVESVLGLVPKGWEVKKIGEVSTVKGGKRLPKGHSLTDKRTKHPYLRVTDVSNGDIKINQLMYITDETYKHICQYTISSADLYISIAGTIGLIGTIRDELSNANLTENMAKLSFEDSRFKNFVYLFLKSDLGKNEISARTVGSTQQKLALTRIRDIPFLLPDETIINSFDMLIENIQKNINLYLTENERCEMIRDALLPKLMSGEIRVPIEETNNEIS